MDQVGSAQKATKPLSNPQKHMGRQSNTRLQRSPVLLLCNISSGYYSFYRVLVKLIALAHCCVVSGFSDVISNCQQMSTNLVKCKKLTSQSTASCSKHPIVVLLIVLVPLKALMVRAARMKYQRTLCLASVDFHNSQHPHVMSFVSMQVPDW